MLRGASAGNVLVIYTAILAPFCVFTVTNIQEIP